MHVYFVFCRFVIDVVFVLLRDCTLAGSSCEAQKCMIGHFVDVLTVATISEIVLDKFIWLDSRRELSL